MADMPQTDQMTDEADIRIAAMYPFAFSRSSQKKDKTRTTKTTKV